jgi:hypothetical protein
MSKEREALQKIQIITHYLPKTDEMPMGYYEIQRIATEALQSESEELDKALPESFKNEPVLTILSNALRHLDEEQLMNLLTMISQRIPNYKAWAKPQSESEWISVETDLPKIAGKYLCVTAKNWVTVLYFDTKYKFHLDSEFVTHWMCLPQAPSIKTPKI